MRFERRSVLPHSAERVFRWHGRPGAFARLVPPWEQVRLCGPHPGLVEGSEAQFELRIGPVPVTWVARHTEVVADRQFVDTMIRGPFASWRHLHRFEPLAGTESALVDTIDYALPFPPCSRIAAPAVRGQLARTFRYRHAVTAGDLALHNRLPTQPLTVAITGASGFIGRTLSAMLTTGGHSVIPLVRRRPGTSERQWNPAGPVDPATFQGVDVVVHLAGESIADGRWSPARQAEIRRSRAMGTAAIAAGMKAAAPGPRLLISASAVGFYGDRGETLLDESASAGTGFFPDVVAAWEAATDGLEAARIRVINTRFGIVLSPGGGALAKMLLPFRLGLGGRLGHGRQWMSWISIDDCAGALVHLIHSGIRGPVNLVAPEPVTNATFTSTLGNLLQRPAVAWVPAPALRLLVGGLADEGLLASTRVTPTKLVADGYQFRHPTLAAGLGHVLGLGEAG